jgi:hypothetical protein
MKGGGRDKGICPQGSVLRFIGHGIGPGPTDLRIYTEVDEISPPSGKKRGLSDTAQ